MDRILICQGKKAEQPYHFQEFELNIYTIEELCYCFYKNLHMLDENIMKEQLCQFVERKLELPQLAEKMRKSIENQKGLEGFVHAVMDDTGYLREEELAKLSQSLREVEGKSTLLRRKAKADFYLENKRYQKAFQEYQEILREEEFENEADKANIYHNIGTVYAGLFLFEEAGKNYAHAYELSGDKESLGCYLQALHMYLPKEAYVKRVAEEMVPEENALATEETLLHALEKAAVSEKRKKMDKVLEYKKAGNISRYYEKLNECLEEYKQEYKNSMESVK